MKQQIYGTKEEFLMRISCGATTAQALIQNLDTDNADAFIPKHNEWKAFKEAANSMSLPTVTFPKLTKTNWKLTNVVLITSCYQLHCNE